jgi:tetratricopeptide (TPR) repeat protein
LLSDPRFVSAWTLLSNALNDQADFGYADREKALAEARSAAERAIEIDPQSADAHLAMHRVVLFQDWNFKAAESQLQLALTLEPKNQWAMGAATDLAIFQGRLDMALEFARRGVEYDPVNPSRYGDLGAALYVSRRYPEALQAYRKALDLNPNREGIHMQIGYVLFASGDPLAALAEFDQDGVDGESCICRVLVYDALGRKAEAGATYAHLLPSQSGKDAYDVALIHAGRGDLDEAFTWFGVAFRQHDGSLLWIKTDPLLKNVQSDPRYSALLAKIGLPN